MKLILTFLLILLFSSGGISQTTLTVNNSPSIGDFQYYVRVDTTGINPGASGANRVWNFLNLTRLDSSVIRWISPQGTPSASEFPNSDIVALDTCHNYFDKDDIRFVLLGFYSHNETGTYGNPELIMQYPFTYNSNFTDNFSGIIPSGNQNVYRTGTVNVTGDAWGTINLPFGSFSNALRVKHVILTKDSIESFPAFYTTYTTYEWYVPNKKFAVFSIDIISFELLGNTYIYKNARYNPGSLAIGIQPISSNVPGKYLLSQNYPNPFNPATNIKFDIKESGYVSLKIFDIGGKQIETLVNEYVKPGSYEIVWNAEKYPSGVYFYSLQAEGFTGIKKALLIK